MLKRTWSTTVTDKAAIVAKREEQLLYDNLASKVSDLYHHPDGFYAQDVLTNVIKKHTDLEVERLYKEGLNNPKVKIYFIISGPRYA